VSARVTFVLADLPTFNEPYGGTFAHGIASMTAMLRRAGHRVNLIYRTTLPTRAEFVTQLRDADPDVVAFSTITHVFPQVRRWIGWTREVLDVPIIVGGVHAILDPEDVVAAPGVNLVCTGEGEDVLLDLCARLERKDPIDTIEGTWHRERGQVRKNPQRPLLADLNALPDPDYSVFDRDRLYGASLGIVSAMISRGCPYRCAYCANARIRDSYPNSRVYSRHLSPGRAVALVENLIAGRTDTRLIVFNDNILYPNRTWLREFSKLYRERIGIPFAGNTRPNLVDDEIVALLRDAGCRRICMGVECGDEDIANRVLRRGQTNRQITEAFLRFRKAGIETVSYNIMGSPFETRRTLLKTVRLNARLQARFLNAFLFYPFPGTEAHDLCRENGFLTGRHGENNSAVVMISQPGLSEIDVLFTQRFFHPLVRHYARLGRWPGVLGRPLLRASDRLLESPMIPRRLLVAMKSAFDGVKNR